MYVCVYARVHANAHMNMFSVHYRQSVGVNYMTVRVQDMLIIYYVL